MSIVGPEGDHLVVAASGYEGEAREALAAHWSGTLTLLSFAGAEREPGYEDYDGP